MTCLVTGTLRNLSGEVLPMATVRFERQSVFGQGGSVVVPAAVEATSDDSGVISIALLPGTYRTTVLFLGRREHFAVGVPAAAEADFADLIRQMPDLTPSVLEECRSARAASAGSAVDAAGSARAAADSALAASGSAGAAAGSAGAAATSAGNAAGSAEEAREAASEAEGHARDALTASASAELGGATGTLSAALGQMWREVERLSIAQESDAATTLALFQLLSLVGQLSGQVNGGRVSLAGGTLADPALRIGTVGIYSAAANTLSVAISGIERLRVTAAGITVYGTVTTA